MIIQISHKFEVGKIYLTIDQKILYSLSNRKNARVKLIKTLPKEYIFLVNKITSQLQQYFLGRRKKFDIPLKPLGTVFQKKVWKGLQSIPYGKTISYKTLACKVASNKHARAVGTANGKNPIPIIIPCHRVIANDGSLGGFSWGLKFKKKLLQIESVTI